MTDPTMQHGNVPAGPVDPRYDYRQFQTGITSQQMRQLADFVFTDAGGYVKSIIAGVKLLVAVAYVIVYEKLVSNEQQMEKQAYEQQHHANNQNEVDQDDLGSTPRAGTGPLITARVLEKAAAIAKKGP